LSGYHDYSVFGLRVRSELELPELYAGDWIGQPDVTVSMGDVPSTNGGEGLHADGDSLVLTIPGVASYRMEGGGSIVVQRAHGAPDRNVRVFLLGSAFGALLHQRGLLPLHANAIEIEGKAVAFLGESGAGKSTLAAWFHDHGYRVLADDVCVVQFDEHGRPLACPGLPRLRLWQEALDASGRRSADYSRSYADEGVWNKYDVPVRAQSCPGQVRLAALLVLGRGEQAELVPLSGVAAAEAVFAHTYRGGYLGLLEDRQNHWSGAVRLVRSTPVYRLTRAWGLDQFNDQFELMVKLIGKRLAGRAESLASYGSG
jgi:hypothetical protein